MEEKFGKDFTIYSFDLFFHGHSRNQQLDVMDSVTGAELARFFKAFADSLELKKFSQIAYSMGGRIAFSLIEHMPAYVKSTVLLAPDGLIDNTWYAFACRTSIGRHMFEAFRVNPFFLLKLGDVLQQNGLLHKKLHRVAMQEAGTQESRDRLYNTWMFLRAVKISKAKVELHIDQYDMGLLILLGEFDKMIPPKKILKWDYLSKREDRVEVLKLGHMMLGRKAFSLIKRRGVFQ